MPPRKQTTQTEAKEAKPKKTKAELSDKSKKEAVRYAAAVGAMCAAEYIGDFTELSSRPFQNKCGEVLVEYIMESISKLQANDAQFGYNPFPADKYIQFDEKAPSKTKAKVKTVEGAMPKAKRLPKKKGAVDPVEDVEAEPDMPEPDVSEAKDAKPETKEAKETKRSHIFQVNRNAKTWIAFIVNRFVYEIYFTTKKIPKSDEEFVKLALSDVTKTFTTQISRVIVPTVERLSDTVDGLRNGDFQNVVRQKITPYFDKSRREGVVQYVTKYLMVYFKLIGQFIANELWVSKRAVNAATIETAMRCLDTGNNKYLIAEGVVKADECDFGLSFGLIHQARTVDQTLNAVEEKKAAVRKPRAAAKVKKEVKEEAEPEAEPADETPDAADDPEPEAEPAEEVQYDDEEDDAEEQPVVVRKLTNVKK